MPKMTLRAGQEVTAKEITSIKLQITNKSQAPNPKFQINSNDQNQTIFEICVLELGAFSVFAIAVMPNDPAASPIR